MCLLWRFLSFAVQAQWSTVWQEIIFLCAGFLEGNSIVQQQGGTARVEERTPTTVDTTPTTAQAVVGESNCTSHVTGHTGLTARLFCCLATGHKTVRILWVRRQDVMILTYDTSVFTTDPRIQVGEQEEEEEEEGGGIEQEGEYRGHGEQEEDREEQKKQE